MAAGGTASDDAASDDAAADGTAADDAAADDAAADGTAADDAAADGVAADGTAADDAADDGAASGGTDVAAPAKPLTRRQKRKARKAALPGRDPVWAKLLVVVGAVLLVVSATVVTGSQVLASRYSNSVHQENLLGANARAGNDDKKEERRSSVSGPLNFLLLGSDLRAKDPEDGQRSDSIIIVHIPVSLDRAYLLSIPRDLRVKIPAFEPTGFRGVNHEKINGAFQHGGGGAGGVQLLAETLTELLGIHFDGAAIVNFDGFKAAVDLLGGVDMCIDQKVTSIHLGYDANGNYLSPEHGGRPAVYEVGCHHLESWQALDLVRQRKSLANGDYDRQKNQQKFIRAILTKAQQQNLTTNPIALDKLIRALGSAFTVDTNGVALEELMFGLRNVRPSSLVGLTVPSETQDIGGISYVIGLDEAQALYTAMRDDTLDAWAVENPTWVNPI
ncbi:LCP family protein [Dactylosporangium aurantiacum]|uniref:LCP family protein n=1 Tax=Dactylosporangium aurantiacum TaxID=35754 RepID=UPI000693BF6F|nr:LCP family protein [Dactylosporangium aurantiacum]